MNAAYQDIPLASIRVSQTSAQAARRAGFDKAALDELAASITIDGVLQPIVVRPIEHSKVLNRMKGDPDYELVAGERRLIAAGRAGLERIPASVRTLTDEQVVRVQLVENLQKESLHPMHEAESYDALLHKHDVSVEQLVAEVGKSKAYIYGRMKLLALSPKARKAFYAGDLSASVAEKLARVPIHSLQDDALPELTGSKFRGGEPLSFRDAVDYIDSNFMLDLRGAPFPTDDAELNKAGPCGLCPKRTGNQPELFADVKKGDTCTDRICFAAKTRAFAQRTVELAKQGGRKIIAGAEAKRVAPNGLERKDPYLADGYRTLDDDVWVGGKYRKAKSLLKDGAEPAILFSGDRAIEVVHESQLDTPKADYNPRTGGSRAAEKRAELDKKVRLATYAAMRPKLKAPALLAIAGALFNRLEHDTVKLLCKVRGFQAPTRTEQYRGKVTDWNAVGKGLEKLDDVELQLFVNDCIFVRELAWGSTTYGRGPHVPKIDDVAKKLRIDVAKIRRELAPKKTAKKKSAK